MEYIVTPGEGGASKAAFADLTPVQLTAVMKRFDRIISDSFLTDEKRHGAGFREKVLTQAEVRRRGKIIFRWFRVMRGENGFSAQQAVDLLPGALRTELDGDDFIPPPRNRLWTPEGVIQ